MADEKFPKIKKSIETFLYEEEGNITRNKVIAVGSMLIIMGLLFGTEVYAGHSSHSSHRSHSSSRSGGSHESHVSHTSHTSHSSGGSSSGSGSSYGGSSSGSGYGATRSIPSTDTYTPPTPTPIPLPGTGEVTSMQIPPPTNPASGGITAVPSAIVPDTPVISE